MNMQKIIWEFSEFLSFHILFLAGVALALVIYLLARGIINNQMNTNIYTRIFFFLNDNNNMISEVSTFSDVTCTFVEQCHWI